MRHLGLFEGIGGFSLAARWMGWETVAYCEYDEFCQSVLKFHYPEAECYGDIKKSCFKKYANGIDILTAGDPCQPSSNAGLRLGESDERFLWPENFRAINESMPGWAVNENVIGTISNGILDKKINQMESIGYTCLPPIIIPARSLGAYHERERVFLIAYSERKRLQGLNAKWEDLCLFKGSPLSEYSYANVFEGNYRPRSNGEHLRGANGIPTQLHKKSIHALGNTIMPQIAYKIFKAIEQYEKIN